MTSVHRTTSASAGVTMRKNVAVAIDQDILTS